ncbi:MAG: TaqI-like C-terminal specificity domain-containing protein [Myxococcales bacterium]
MSTSLSSLPPSDSLVAVGIQRFEASMLALLAPAEPVNPVPSRAKRRPKKAGSSSTPPELPELEREGEPEAASAAQRGVADVAATADSTAAESFFGQLGAGTPLDAQRLAALQRRVTVDVLRSAVLGLATEREGFAKWRLFDDRICGVEERSLATDWRKLEPLRVASAGPEELGELLESLLALAAHEKRGKLHFAPSQQRKQKGMFYTPRGVVDSVVKTAIAPWLEPGRPLPRVCDPSMGGGAFLLGVARELARAQGVSIADDQLRRAIVVHFSGFDIEPLAIAIAEAALLLWSRGGDEEAAELNRQLRITDALEVHDECAYDLVIGNPPWVAYAGRATQPLSEQRRAWLAKSFEAFRGYPTMQACFVELAARLAPAGRIALLVPSPIADLDGYRPMRCVLTRTHRVDAELVEYGQDAFEGVVQPCFGLIADADAASRESEAPFVLAERSGLDAAAERVEVPECLVQLERLDRFPGDCFKEYGFQTAAEVTREMLLRADAPSPPFEYPLLEGKDVSEFTVGAPRVFLNADRERLRALSCRLREAEEYRQVELVVRQTAKYTIAALHSGLPFRNSLLAGFGSTQFSAAVLVGLLNSTLVRSVHMAARRDARQRTFPQVKVAHLRALPAPPTDAQRAREMELLVRSLGNAKPSLAQREQLDALVYGWYGITSRDAVVIDRFFDQRGR